MQKTVMTEEKAQQRNMLKIFGLTIVYSFLISFMLSGMVIHQIGAIGMIGEIHQKLTLHHLILLLRVNTKMHSEVFSMEHFTDV